MSNELAVVDRRKEIMSVMESKADSFALIAAKGVDAKRATKQAATAIVQNAGLLECSTGSLCMSVAQAVELGLDLAKARGEAYLVPYKQKGKPVCQLVVGYQGWIKLALESGLVSSIDAQVVYEGEEFDARLGTDFYINHRPSFSGSRIVGAYAVATMPGGAKLPLILREADVSRARAASRATSGPWITDEAAMVRKTAVLRLMKLLPKSPVMGKALAFDADSRYDEQPTPPPARPRNVRDILSSPADPAEQHHGDDFDQSSGYEDDQQDQTGGEDFIKSLNAAPTPPSPASDDPRATTEAPKGADAAGGTLPGMGAGRKK